MSPDTPSARDDGIPRAQELAARRFREIHGIDPEVSAWAPGRVNLIGDHTDTSEGYVLPLTLRVGIGVALRGAERGTVRLRSVDFDESWEGGWERPGPSSGWERYLLGVACALTEGGEDLPGCDAVLASDLPPEIGLASSAAVGVSFARGLAGLFGLGLDDHRIAHLCRKSENEFVGVQCGIMDPFSVSVGRGGDAIFLDTRTLSYRKLPMPKGWRVGVLPSGVRRQLSSSPYNDRRRETERAARLLGVRTLRDVTPQELPRLLPSLPSPERERARHVVTENRRVLEAVDALLDGDGERFGALCDRSHFSLRDDYEASCPELETLTAICRAEPGCLGARLTGAGFGGSAICLLQEGAAERALGEIARRYTESTGTTIRPLLA